MAHKGGHGYPRTQQIRKERRERAEAVAAETGFSKLTTQQKLDRVLALVATPGCGEAKKQIARLTALLVKEQEKKATPVAQTKKTEQEVTSVEAEKLHFRKGRKSN